MHSLRSALVGVTISLTLIVFERNVRTTAVPSKSSSAEQLPPTVLPQKSGLKGPSEKKNIEREEKKIAKIPDKSSVVSEDIGGIEEQRAEQKREIYAYDRAEWPKVPKGKFWLLPPVKRYRITSGFGKRISPFTGKMTYHKGIDFSAPYGTPVFAAAPGRVVKSGWISDTCGLGVIIAHGMGRSTIYCHMSIVYTEKGDRVLRGENIGMIGSTGRSTGPHLHFSLRINRAFRDPLPFIIRK